MIRNHVARALLITLLLGGLLSGGIAIASAEEGFDPKVVISSKSPDSKSEVFGEIIRMVSDDQELFIHNGILNKRKLLVKSPLRYEPEIT